jgi:hypothetical protein
MEPSRWRIRSPETRKRFVIASPKGSQTVLHFESTGSRRYIHSQNTPMAPVLRERDGPKRDASLAFASLDHGCRLHPLRLRLRTSCDWTCGLQRILLHQTIEVAELRADHSAIRTLGIQIGENAQRIEVRAHSPVRLIVTRMLRTGVGWAPLCPAWAWMKGANRCRCLFPGVFGLRACVWLRRSFRRQQSDSLR